MENMDDNETPATTANDANLTSTPDTFMEVTNIVLQSVKPINDNIHLFYVGLDVVTIAKYLALLAASADDVSLISNSMTKDQFEYLKHPESLRTTVCHLSATLCDASLKNDYLMGTFWTELVDIPTAILDVFAEAAGGNDTIKLNRLIQRAKRSLEKCKDSNKEVVDSVNSVLDVLEELIVGSNSAKSTNENDVKDAEEMLTKLRIEENQKNEDIAKRESEHQKAIKLVQEAQNDYKKASLSFCDYQGFDVVEMAKDINLETVIKVGAGFVLTKGTVAWAFFALDLGVSFYRYIDSKQKENAEKIQKLVKALDIARNRLDIEQKQKDANMEAMHRSQRELADLMAGISNLDLTKVKMSDVISLLAKILPFLMNFKEQWTKLAQFFDVFYVIVQKLFNQITTDFTEEREDSAVEALIKPALIASGMCVQICNFASIYREISKQFVLPGLATVDANLLYSKEAAKVKMDMAPMEHENLNESVRQLIDTKREDIMNELKDNLAVYQTELLQTMNQ